MERRRVLTALGTVAGVVALEPVLSGCTSDSPNSSGASPSASVSGSAVPRDPRAEAARVESDLVTRAANIEARWPTTASAVAPVQAAHTAHVVALVGTTPTPTPPVSASEFPGTGSSPAAALRGLAAAERAAATSHAAGAQNADPADARLLASVAAYAAAQDVVLTRASTTEGVGR